MQPIGESLSVAHQTSAARIFTDADNNPLARGPWPLNGARPHFRKQLLVDALGSPTQRELAECGEIGRRKEMFERALGLFRNVDFSFLEPLDQIIWCEIDQFDGIGTIKNRVRHGSRTRTWVICATTSLRLSICWMLTVV